MLHEKPTRKAELEDDLYAEDECSEEVSTVPGTVKKKPMLCFISFEHGKLTHVARAEIRYRARTKHDRIDLWRLEAFPTSVPIRPLATALLKIGARVAAERALRGGHLPPRAFSQVIEALKSRFPDAHSVVDGLWDAEESARVDVLPEPARVNWMYQRDAVATALAISGIPRNQLGGEWQPDAIPTDVKSIFDRTGEARSLEDALVLRDLEGHSDWSPLTKRLYPAKTFSNGETVLTVVLANKFPLERQLGVDLIYVNETRRSVVFVQYKMFDGDDGEKGYRPDRQLKIEICRMDRTAAVLASCERDVSCGGYRLAEEAFYLKFCRRVMTHDGDGLVPGVHLPLTYFKRLLIDPRVKGPKGGVRLTPSNIGRHLTLTTFKDLFIKGWIGASMPQTSLIVPYLRDAIQGKRSIALAIETKRTEPSPPDEDVDPDEDDLWTKHKPAESAPPKGHADIEDDDLIAVFDDNAWSIGPSDLGPLVSRKRRRRRPGNKPRIIQI